MPETTSARPTLFPPPWTWVYHPETRHPSALSSPAGYVLIASGNDHYSYLFVTPYHRAALAAVPELLRACEYALDLLERKAGGQTARTAGIGLIGGQQAARLLREALAKAGVDLTAEGGAR